MPSAMISGVPASSQSTPGTCHLGGGQGLGDGGEIERDLDDGFHATEHKGWAKRIVKPWRDVARPRIRRCEARHSLNDRERHFQLGILPSASSCSHSSISGQSMAQVPKSAMCR